MSQMFKRFDGNADCYARFRPAYPDGLVEALCRAILTEPSPGEGIEHFQEKWEPVFRPEMRQIRKLEPHSDSIGLEKALVVDVGSGTGIFTRQLREGLPDHVPVIGIEPASSMRHEAEASRAPGQVRIDYRDGTAEALPIGDETARAVVAATAAHWFDRPAFYAEARRVLKPGGVLGIIEYIRDVDGSPAAAALEGFLRRHGGPKVYLRPDYAAELRDAGGFGAVEVLREAVTLGLSCEGFAGLALSSSHARAPVAAMGQEAAERELHEVAEGLAGASGKVPYGYVFQLFITRRMG